MKYFIMHLGTYCTAVAFCYLANPSAGSNKE